MLADIQRKQAPAHGVVKCTCESDDLLFLLEVDGVKKELFMSRRDNRRVSERPMLNTRNQDVPGQTAPEQIFVLLSRAWRRIYNPLFAISNDLVSYLRFKG